MQHCINWNYWYACKLSCGNAQQGTGEYISLLMIFALSHCGQKAIGITNTVVGSLHSHWTDLPLYLWFLVLAMILIFCQKLPHVFCASTNSGHDQLNEITLLNIKTEKSHFKTICEWTVRQQVSWTLCISSEFSLNRVGGQAHYQLQGGNLHNREIPD